MNRAFKVDINETNVHSCADDIVVFAPSSSGERLRLLIMEILIYILEFVISVTSMEFFLLRHEGIIYENQVVLEYYSERIKTAE